MSVYWEKTNKITGDEIDAMKFPGEHWHEVDTAPIDGEKFLGRLKGTNRVRAVWWSDEFNSFCDGKQLVEITQWTSFKEYAQVQQCVWNGGCN